MLRIMNVLLLGALSMTLLAPPAAEAFLVPTGPALGKGAGATVPACGLSAAHSTLLAAVAAQRSAKLQLVSFPPRVRTMEGACYAAASASVETADATARKGQAAKDKTSTLKKEDAAHKTKDTPAAAKYKTRAGRRAVKDGRRPAKIDNSEVRAAFEVFAWTLLRPKGRVRFATINNAFRREFPRFADENKVSNQTLGRLVQQWYEQETGKPLVKTTGGAYSNLTMLNYNYASVDLSRLRAAQASTDPAQRKAMESLGILESMAAPARAPGRQGTARSRAAGAARQQKREAGGKMKAAGKPGVRGGRQAAMVAQQERDAAQQMKDAVRLCMDSFTSCVLEVSPASQVTFREIAVLFRKHFPILEAASGSANMEAALGRQIKEWYERKAGRPLERASGADKAPRSQQPFVGLAVRSVDDIDFTLMNEAKVKLRRTLKLEGVGVMVKRSRGGEFAVAAIIPGSPAALEGSVEPGDVILAVNDAPVDAMTPAEMADAVLGVRGSTVSLTLRRSARDAAGPSDTEGLLERVFHVSLAVAGAVISELELADRYREKLTFGGSA